ncbi:hypothetical protein CBR_g45535 [Chara braunii]|uniref:Uncharacterized protein n=1 Tax=Chara braunii TaxID=69332 RepID=A0A388LYT1_CHABU|nr:hypothetical protein CBR_g45535 [Chara braunii]|eukprot:GBG87477.1 hypothetical protein CBR_g45535 [Chara braunii]
MCRSLGGWLSEHPPDVPDGRWLAVLSPVCTLIGACVLSSPLAVDEGDFSGVVFGTLYSSYEGLSSHALGGFQFARDGRVVLWWSREHFCGAVRVHGRLSRRAYFTTARSSLAAVAAVRAFMCRGAGLWMVAFTLAHSLAMIGA